MDASCPPASYFAPEVMVLDMTSIALHIPGVLVQHAKEPWAKPASALMSSHRLDHMHWVQQEGVEFLFAHPKPGLAVMNSASK